MNTETQKIHSLENLYSSLMDELLHVRSSSMNYIFAYYGYLVLSIGFIISQNGSLKSNQKLSIFFLTLVLGGLSFLTSVIFKKKANEISQALCNIEHYWICFSENIYIEKKSILPKKWSSLEANSWRNPEFNFQLISSALITSLCVLILLIY